MLPMHGMSLQFQIKKGENEMKTEETIILLVIAYFIFKGVA